MGFWSQITGGEAVAAAYNAVLMEHLLTTLNKQERQELSARVIPVIRRAISPSASDAEVARLFNRAERPIQLNLLCYAAIDLEHYPAVGGAKWFDIRNPFAALPSEEIAWKKVRDAERLILYDHGIDVLVPMSPFHIPDDWHQSDVLDVTDEPTLPPGQKVHICLAPMTWDEQHTANDQRYDAGEIDTSEHLQNFRKILLAEVADLIRRGP